MNRLDRLANGLEARRKNLLKELDLVNSAIEHAKIVSIGDVNATEWINKLQKWHEELRALIDNLPRMDRKKS